MKNITQLRKDGRLEDAKQLALNLYNDDPSNVWNIRNLAWVYYEFIKLNNDITQFDVFCKNVKSLLNLNISEKENVLLDALGWQFYQMAKNIVLQGPSMRSAEYSLALWDLLKKMPYLEKPSLLYSKILDVFLKVLKNSNYVYDFICWWNLDNFRDGDFVKFQTNEGKSIMSLAERTYIAYAKGLLYYVQTNKKEYLNVDIINKVIIELDVIESKYPTWIYIPYYKAKLLIAQGGNTDVLSSILPFARRKQSDFWIWDLLGDLVNELDVKLACYCRGLLCSAPEKMTIKLMEKLVYLLIHLKLYSEAKVLINKCIDVRSENDWKIPYSLESIVKSDWYISTDEKLDIKVFFKRYESIADSVLYSDLIESSVIVIEDIKHPKFLSVVTGEKEVITLYYPKAFSKQLRVGDTLKVRLEKSVKGRFTTLTFRKDLNNDLLDKYVKPFNGKIKITPIGIGFLDDVFFSPTIVEKYKLKNRDIVAGKAIVNYDKKKKKWGWSAFVLKKKI